GWKPLVRSPPDPSQKPRSGGGGVNGTTSSSTKGTPGTEYCALDVAVALFRASRDRRRGFPGVGTPGYSRSPRRGYGCADSAARVNIGSSSVPLSRFDGAWVAA